MDLEFVERRNGGFYLAASRVPLDFIVREFQQGESPEAIRSDFPTLSLEQVYGRLPSTWATRTKWRKPLQNVRAKKMLTAQRIRRPQT